MRPSFLDRLRRDGGERLYLAFFLVFALIFVRYCCYGLEYFPQLDDYIQHHNYAAYHSDLWQFMLDLGVLASRPASGVLDIVFWSRFWPVMIIGVALISAMYAGSALLFRQVWRKYFGTGWLFVVLYALLPLGMEGTYWMSASTRVVPSLFFVSLAMWLFQTWCVRGRKRFLALYFLVQLLSFCFYEQGLVLSITGVILVGLLEFREHRGRALWALLTFLNVICYFGFTSIFSQSGLYASRLEVLLPWQDGWLSGVFHPVRRQIFDAFVKGGVFTLFKGFGRGVGMIFSEGHWLWLAVVLALCAALFWLVRRQTGEDGKAVRGSRTILALVVGFLMALAPVTIFFILENPWFSLRGTVPSFCGAALMADALAGLLLSRLKPRRTVTAALCAGLSLAFCVAAVSEMHDYRATYENDHAVLAAVCAATDNGAALPAGETTVILGVEPSSLPDQNFYFHEHIHGVTESSWALTGALMYASGNGEFPTVKPLASSTIAATLAEERYGALYLYVPEAGIVRPVTAVLADDWNYDLYTPDGALCGRVTAQGLARVQTTGKG